MSPAKYRISLMRSASVAMRTSNHATGLGNKLIANPDTSSFVKQSPDHLEAVEALCGHYGNWEMAVLRVNSSKRYPEGYEAIERELEDCSLREWMEKSFVTRRAAATERPYLGPQECGVLGGTAIQPPENRPTRSTTNGRLRNGAWSCGE